MVQDYKFLPAMQFTEKWGNPLDDAEILARFKRIMEMPERGPDPKPDQTEYFGIRFKIPEGIRAQSLQFLEELALAWDLHLRKSAGYSGHSEDVWANFRTGKLGVNDGLGIAVRLNDKFNRMVSILMDPANDQVNEPLNDLLSDIAAYCYIWKCILREQDNSSTGIIVELTDQS